MKSVSDHPSSAGLPDPQRSARKRPRPEPLRLAVFDLDGTLVDSLDSIVSAMTTAWRAHGLGDVRPEAVRRIIGLPLVEAIAELFPGGGRADHVSLSERYKTAFGDLQRRPEHRDNLYPGAAAALDALEKEGVLLGIATSKSMKGLVRSLERHGLRRRFSTLQTADAGPGKPSPEMLFRAMAETGVTSVDTVMIGDTIFDMEMARNAGVAAIGVGWGYHESHDLKSAGASVVVDSFDDVPGTFYALVEES